MSSQSLREKPTQQRAQTRLDKILSVAETMMLERGFDEFKMNQLSQLAEVNIATIYRYFPNKTAIAMDLLDRYLESYRQQLSSQLHNIKIKSIEQVVDLLVEGYLAFFQDNPAFVSIWKGLSGTQTFKKKDVEDSRHNSCLLCELVKPHFPDVQEARLSEALFLICEMTGNLMPTILVLDADEAQSFKNHLKKMISGYMKDLL